MTVSEAIDNRLHNTTTSGSIVTKSGISVDVLGTFDQPTSLHAPYLVTNIRNAQDAHLESASPRQQPTPGQLGDIQAKSDSDINFIFNALMVECNNYDKAVDCHIPNSYISVMQNQKPNILPRSVHNHHVYVNTDGVLESTLLQSAPVSLHIRFRDLKVSFQRSKICPQIIAAESPSGCHSCHLNAKISIKARSLCSPGEVSVSFNDIPLSTRSVYLTSEITTIVIRFVTNKACHKERICLFNNGLRSCEAITFCLDDPAIELTLRNVSYTRDIAASRPDNTFDSFLSGISSFGSKFQTALYYFIGILVALFTFSLTITLLKR